ncbi:MAG: hypothetical protein HFI91_07290 [Lachnospiraceae bacterium]|jgi:hypothetical protein|nr:hypothetical protein [Lachnospiraceae bacterium]
MEIFPTLEERGDEPVQRQDARSRVWLRMLRSSNCYGQGYRQACNRFVSASMR